MDGVPAVFARKVGNTILKLSRSDPKPNILRYFLAFSLILGGMALPIRAFQAPSRPQLANFDRRSTPAVDGSVSSAQKLDAENLRRELRGIRINFDPITGTAIVQSSPDSFLTGPDGIGGANPGSLHVQLGPDPYRAAKAFLMTHQALFGHGSEILKGSRLVRDDVSQPNGLRTVVFQQQIDGIKVFEGLITAHMTREGKLINLFSHASRSQSSPYALRPSPTGNKSKLGISSKQALGFAMQAIEVASSNPDLADMELVTPPNKQEPEQHQKIRASGLNGTAEASLVWLPMNAEELKLCWEVILTSHERGEMFRVLIDAGSGEVLLRHCLTEYLSNATYRVYTGESPSPFSPGQGSPSSAQPSLVPRTLVITNTFDTNASPLGWIADGDNETRGNNVDAHLDRDGDDLPDLPRPQGSPFRVFDYSLDLSQSPINYGDAAVTQLFFLCNWYHDRLYELGFTESAGNFQGTNFGRGGLGGDAVQADAQDGGGVDNANFTTPPDGSPGRMQMYTWNGANPNRDGDLDAEIVFHEHTHGVSGRLVGGGVGISALQTQGMGEGWSDFYALCLLRGPGDDVNGTYHIGAYSIYGLGGFNQNYYFGIRRYPYCTDLSKSPLTFKDIDGAQASAHPGIPRNPIIGNTAGEVHNMGEIWCAALWEARALLVEHLGFAAGNQLILQLVTTGMKLSPANPNFIQARDAILQADSINNNGANQRDLWQGFAKRGLGFSATSPASSTTSGVIEAFDTPDDLKIAPSGGLQFSGPVGGPFMPNFITLNLTNLGMTNLEWSLSNTSSWLSVSLSEGALTPSDFTNIDVSTGPGAASLQVGLYSESIVFSNHITGVSQARCFSLKVGDPDYFTELFDANDNDLAFSSITFSPDGSGNFYSSCREPISDFYVEPTGGNVVSLGDDTYRQVTLAGTNTVGLFGQRTNVFFIGSNGYLTFGSGEPNQQESLVNHFSKPRISALFHDLDPSAQGTVSWKQLPDRVAVSFQSVPQYSSMSPNNFQMELFYDGTIRLSYLAINCLNNLVGLSAGHGVPMGFTETDFSSNDVCSVTPPAIVSQPVDAFGRAGATVSFSVFASGSQTLSYQWQKDNVALNDGGGISGSTNATLNIGNIGTNDAGVYTVTISNLAGQVTSSGASLVVSLLDHFAWAHIPNPQSAAVPFQVSLLAEAADDTVLSNYAGMVELRGVIDHGSTTNTALPSPSPAFTNSGMFTLGYSFTPQTNLMLTHFRHYSGVKVSLWTDEGTLMVSENVSSIGSSWSETPLTNPIPLRAGVRYRIGVSTGGGSFFWRSDLAGSFPDGTIDQGYQCLGDAFPETVDSTRWWFVDFRYTVARTNLLPISPVTANLANGLWEGSITIPGTATNLALWADDGLGSIGVSEHLNIISTPFLSARKSANTISLSWMAGASDLKLETCTNLAAPVWTVNPQQPSMMGDTNVLSVNLDERQRFFRLHYSR